MFYILIIMIMKIIISEGRVFCQDSYAMPWKPLGHSCPVSCHTVVTAVNRLKLFDYEKVEEFIREKMDLSDIKGFNVDNLINMNELISRKSGNKLNKHITTAYGEILKNKKCLEHLKYELDNMADHLKNGTCDKMAAGGPLKIYTRLKCTRKYYNSNVFLKRLTAILNKFSPHKFDEELTAMIIKRLIGSSNLRIGMSDIRKIVTYLQKVLKYHDIRAKDNVMISLKSKHCLTIHISGCYCQPGFVENSGQCVEPKDCIHNPLHKKYLDKVVVY